MNRSGLFYEKYGYCLRCGKRLGDAEAKYRLCDKCRLHIINEEFEK